MSGFQVAEDKGRELFSAFLQTRPTWTLVEFSKGRFDAYDAIIENEQGEKSLVEIKVRSAKYEAYNDLLLEEVKLNRLREARELLGASRIYYFNFYEGSRTVKVADITDLSIAVFDTLKAPKTTVVRGSWFNKAVAYVKNFKVFTI